MVEVTYHSQITTARDKAEDVVRTVDLIKILSYAKHTADLPCSCTFQSPGTTHPPLYERPAGAYGHAWSRIQGFVWELNVLSSGINLEKENPYV